MVTAKAWLEDWLFRHQADDQIFLYKWPPNTDEFAITKDGLLSLRPAPLPDAPPDPPPTPPPPAEEDWEEMGVASQVGLIVRDGPNPLANRLETLPFNTVVRVQKRPIVGGKYIYSVLLAVNGTKYLRVGYVARGTVDGSEVYLVPKV